MNTEKLLVDTNIFVDYLRGYETAINFFNDYHQNFLTSTITIAELYSGVKGEQERYELDKLTVIIDAIPVSAKIAKKGGLFKNQYSRSHGVGIADAVIAATAIETDATLITLNIKHFPMVQSKRAPY